jgi:D-alanyl-D-alanine dipeptidase
MTMLRANKNGYDTRFQIDAEHPLHNDPLVDPREPEFGFYDSSSYYSKPNSMTGEQLPGVPDAPLVRRDVARRLKVANFVLQNDPDVRESLGAPARIRIDDALRPYAVQKFAHDVAWPKVIKRVNPHFTDEQIAAELPKYVAEPKSPNSPTPHITGGAVDVRLINLETNEPFDRGHSGGAVKGTAFPDFHEGYQLLSGQSDIELGDPEEIAPEDSEVVASRRVLYWTMTKAGLYVNPTEIWHYGKGDPLSEYVSGSGRPYYGIAELPEWYLAQMKPA